MRSFFFITVIATLLISSCGRIPEPVGYDYSQQQKLQAGNHWNILAADTANEINRELILADYLDVPVYIRETCGDENTPCRENQTTVFNESFRDLLITQLVNLGVPTSAEPQHNAITVNYKAQTVYHHTNRIRTIRPGLITALTAGVMVLREAPTELIAILTAGAVDFANANYVHSGHFEVIITTSMIAKNKYLYRNSSIYYINDKDSWHYQHPSDPVEIEITANNTIPVTEPTPEPEEKTIELPLPIFPDTVPQPGSTEI